MHECWDYPLFPASSPLQIREILPAITAQFGKSPVSYFVFQRSFETTITYPTDRPFDATVPCQFGIYPLAYKGMGMIPSNLDLSLPAYRSPADLLQVDITPKGPLTIPQGQAFEFRGAIIPKPDLGEGRMDGQENTLDLLKGYKATGLKEMVWTAILASDVKKIGLQPWLFPFEPMDGTGTYRIVASALVDLEEKDTNSPAQAKGVSETSVKVNPSLRILSPRQDLTYPKDWVVKVVTTLDSAEDRPKWKTLKWYVNEVEVKPNTDTPPWDLELNKVGTWSLKVSLPDPSNPQIELATDTVTFQVKPVSVSITPTKKVLSSTPRQEIPLQTIVELEGHQLPKPGDYVAWGSGEWKATVKSVEWKAFTVVSGCATLEPDQSNLLEAKTTFTTPGAETVLATVTIQVELGKANKKKPPEIFTLPAVRADLWAIASPFWGSINEKLPPDAFPKEAIALSRRSFNFKTGNFAFEFDTYTWLPTGLSKPVTLQAALKSDPLVTATANKIDFAWKGPEDQTSANSSYAPVFRNSTKGTAILLNTNLDFGTAGNVPFTEISVPVKVVPLADIVDFAIEPASFSMPVNTTKEFHCVIKPKPEAKPHSPQAKDDLIYLLKNTYTLSLNSVLWTWNLTGKKREIVSPEFAFTPANPGNYEIAARASVSVQEVVPDDPAPAMNNELSARITGTVNFIPKVDLISISFLDAGVGSGGDNEHMLFENSSDLGGWGAGSPIVNPVWKCGADANSAPAKNSPICYTRTTTTVDSKMKLEVVLRLQPAGVKFDLVGLDGATEYFKTEGETSTGEEQTVSVVASQNLPSTVEKLTKEFTWKVVFTDSDPVTIQTTSHDIYVVYSSPISTLTPPEGENWNQENKPTPKRLDFCIVTAGAKGRGEVHGPPETSIARQLQIYIAKEIFYRLGKYNKYPTPSPIWTYVKTNEEDGFPQADCIQQACMLTAALQQLGITARGDRAYPSSDEDCTSMEVHLTVPERVLRYVTNQTSPDTDGDAYPNNFQGATWVKDENDVMKFYTVWYLLPPRESLLGVLQEERQYFDTDVDFNQKTKYRQYWSYPINSDKRFIDEELHPKQAVWPPVWGNDVPLP